MAHSREDVVASVRASFPKESRARTLELLDTYGVAAHERERERVQLAILKLSEGKEERLRQYVGVAKRDYRDVLFWAEYPEDRKSTRLNSSHSQISYAVFCLKKKKIMM